MSWSRRHLLQAGGLASLATACNRRARREYQLELLASNVVRPGPPWPAGLPGVAVAPAVFLHELEGAVKRDVFHDNLLVGNIWFAGGYELMADEENQYRSVEVRIDREAEYGEQVPGVVQRLLTEALTAAGRTQVHLDEVVVPALPRRESIRGTMPLEGQDSQNLPRFTVSPVGLPPESIPTLPATAPALLVPVVVHYYTHNGGWFVGQEQGCPAGARFRLLWSLHDGTTGHVLSWADHEARYVQPYTYSPSRVMLEDYQMRVEQLVLDQLVAAFSAG